MPLWQGLGHLRVLFDKVKKSHVQVIWRDVQPKLRELMPGPALTLVWDPQTRSAELALDREVESVRSEEPNLDIRPRHA